MHKKVSISHAVRLPFWTQCAGLVISRPLEIWSDRLQIWTVESRDVGVAMSAWQRFPHNHVWLTHGICYTCITAKTVQKKDPHPKLERKRDIWHFCEQSGKIFSNFQAVYFLSLSLQIRSDPLQNTLSWCKICEGVENWSVYEGGRWGCLQASLFNKRLLEVWSDRLHSQTVLSSRQRQHSLLDSLGKLNSLCRCHSGVNSGVYHPSSGCHAWGASPPHPTPPRHRGVRAHSMFNVMQISGGCYGVKNICVSHDHFIILWGLIGQSLW